MHDYEDAFAEYDASDVTEPDEFEEIVSELEDEADDTEDDEEESEPEPEDKPEPKPIGTLTAHSVMELERIQSKGNHQAIFKSNGDIAQINVSLGDDYKDYDIGALYVIDMSAKLSQASIYDIEVEYPVEDPVEELEGQMTIDDVPQEAVEWAETPDEGESWGIVPMDVDEATGEVLDAPDTAE